MSTSPLELMQSYREQGAIAARRASTWRLSGRTGRAAAVAAIATLSACATADRKGAGRLADMGIGVSQALVAEVESRQRRIRDAAADDGFNHAFTVMARCVDAEGRSRITRAGSTAEADCDVIATAETRRRSGIALTAKRLAEVVGRRADAAEALGTAYRAFAAEAEYDAATDLEGALKQAAAAVDGFGQAVGLTPLGTVIAEGVTQFGGAMADSAQRRRLLRANDTLRGLSTRMRQALERERREHAAIEAVVASLSEETARNLVRAGLLNSAPTMRGIADRLGLPMLGEAGVQAAMARNPALDAAAAVATLVRSERERPDPFGPAISALAALDLQHAAYAEGRPVSARDATAALGRLASVARIAVKEEQER